MAITKKNSRFNTRPDKCTTSQIDELQATEGIIVYDTDIKSYKYWNGTEWIDFFAFSETQQIDELLSVDYSDGFGGGVNDSTDNFDWDIDTTKGNGNSYSMRCLLGENPNRIASIKYTFTSPEAVSRITFDYQQMLEGYPWDALLVLVDGVELFHGENLLEWTAAEVMAFGKGEHILEFKGVTDGNTYITPNTIWVDNLKIEYITAQFVPAADCIFKGHITMEKTAYLEEGLRVEGKTHLNELSIKDPLTSLLGAVESNFTGEEDGAKNFAFQSKGDKTLGAGKTFYTVTGGYRISTDTVSNSNTLHRFGVRNTVETYNGEAIAWDNADDDIPYAFMSLGRANKTNVFISAMPKDKGASAIGSRLQVGHDQWTPNQTNMNTLDVDGNVMVSENIEVSDVGEGLILASPDGTRYKITIENGGGIISTAL